MVVVICLALPRKRYKTKCSCNHSHSRAKESVQSKVVWGIWMDVSSALFHDK